LRRFGLITTNSLKQTFNRRVVQAALDRRHRRSLSPVPDHPWVDSADGAAVRIAMTVGAPGSGEGRLLSVTAEHEGKGEGLDVDTAGPSGAVACRFADWRECRSGSKARDLGQQSLHQLAVDSTLMHGSGFIVTADRRLIEASKPMRRSNPTATAAI
jgi:hypothetical protein